MKDYAEGRLDQARAEFLTLAALGDSASQFNLGAMAMQGQAGPKDMGAAVGWLSVAAENGSRRLAPDKLADMRARLSDDERKTADDIKGRYGRAALERTALPIPAPGAHCRNLVPPQLTRRPDADDSFYPRGGRFNDQNGFVIVEITVGVDGVPRDPKVLMAVPGPEFSAAAVDLWMRARYTPASQDGVPVEARVSVQSNFSIRGGGGVLWDLPALKAIRETALTGDPKAQYQIGLAAMLDRSLGIPIQQAFGLLVSSAQGGHPPAQYYVANLFMSVGSCGVNEKKLPWLRAAAQAGSGPAQLALAESLLAGQPSPDQIAEARGLLEQAAQSDDYYVMKHVAALLASSPVEALRDAPTAKAVADRLMKDPISTDPQKYEAAAAAYAAAKDFWMAGAKEQAAIKAATKLQWNGQPMQERLALYRKSQSWTGNVLAGSPPGAAPSATASVH